MPVDVAALNRDYKVEIVVGGLRGHGSKKRFTPVYWVDWPAKPKGSGCVALVRLFLPTKTLTQLRVEDPKYILRNPVFVTNNASATSESMPVGTKARDP